MDGIYIRTVVQQQADKLRITKSGDELKRAGVCRRLQVFRDEKVDAS